MTIFSLGFLYRSGWGVPPRTAVFRDYGHCLRLSADGFSGFAQTTQEPDRHGLSFSDAVLPDADDRRP